MGTAGTYITSFANTRTKKKKNKSSHLRRSRPPIWQTLTVLSGCSGLGVVHDKQLKLFANGKNNWSSFTNGSFIICKQQIMELTIGGLWLAVVVYHYGSFLALPNITQFPDVTMGWVGFSESKDSRNPQEFPILWACPHECRSINHQWHILCPYFFSQHTSMVFCLRVCQGHKNVHGILWTFTKVGECSQTVMNVQNWLWTFRNGVNVCKIHERSQGIGECSWSITWWSSHGNTEPPIADQW